MQLSRRSLLAGGAGGALSLIFSSGSAFGQADPWTIAAACAALAQGALNYAGGAIFQSAIGAAKITDVKTWIIEAVQEIEAFVSALISQTVMDQMTSDLAGSKTKLEEYAALADPTKSQDLLAFSDDATSRLIPLALQYDRALFVAIAAQSYRLFTLQARYKADGEGGHITSEKDNLDYFVTVIASMRDRVAQPMGPGAHIKQACIPTPLGGSPLRLRFDKIVTDGQLSKRFPNECFGTHPDVIAYAATLGAPFQESQNVFLSKVNNLLSLTTQCYDGMCRQIGGSYTPP